MSSTEEEIKKAYSILRERISERNISDELIGDNEREKEYSDRNLSGYYYDYQKAYSGNDSLRKAVTEIYSIENTLDRDRRYDRLMKAMEHPEIDGGLKIHADEAVTRNAHDEIYNVYHPNKEVKKKIYDMIDRTGLREISWQSIYNFCGIGDEFREIIFSLDGKRIQRLNYIPPKLIGRMERNSVLQYFFPRESSLDSSDSVLGFGNYSWDYLRAKSSEEKKIEKIDPFRILHSRIPSYKYAPYGESVIDRQVAVIEKLVLLEQSMLIARLTRSPERRLYNIVVGNHHGEKAWQEAQRAYDRLKRKKILDFFGNGKTDKTFDFWGSVEDIVIPRIAGQDPSTVDTLPGINNTSENGDVEFVRDRLFPGFMPRAYIYDDSFANANQALSNKNIPFYKKTRRIQNFHLHSVYKLCAIEMSLAGYSREEIMQLKLTMNNPSNLDERERLDVQNTLWGLVSSVKGVNSDETPFFPDYLIYRDILNLSNEEILLIQKLSLYQKDKKNPFYAVPKEDRPPGFEELDALLNPEMPEDTDSMEDEGSPDDYDSEYSDSSDEIPGSVANALSDMGGERDLENASLVPDSEGKNIVLEAVKESEILRRKAMLKKKKRLQKILIERNIINESENLDDLDVNDIILKMSVGKKKKDETKMTASLEYLEGCGEFAGEEKNMEVNQIRTYMEEQLDS